MPLDKYFTSQRQEKSFIWEVWNPDLKKTLKRYGFRRTKREEPDETITGFKWRAEP